MTYLYPDLPKERQEIVLTAAKRVYLAEKENKLLREDISLFLADELEDGSKAHKNLVRSINTDCQKTLKSKEASFSDKRTALRLLANIKSPMVEAESMRILNDPQAVPSLKITAAWTLGRKTDQQERVNTIANLLTTSKPFYVPANKDNEVELKEMLIASLCKFKDKKEVILPLLDQAQQVDPGLQKTVNAYKEMLSENYNTVEDYVISQSTLTPQEVAAYKTDRNTYIEGFDNLTTAQKNWTDKALIPFRSILSELAKGESRLVVTDDMVTSVFTDIRGQMSSHGFFEDAAAGMAGSDGRIVSRLEAFGPPETGRYTLAHEWGHRVHSDIMKNHPDIADKIEENYNKAIEENRCLDFYAETNYHEYFAQCFKTFNTLYTGHGYLINDYIYDDRACQTNVCHPSTRLERLDKPMYDLLTEIYALYDPQKTL